MKNKNENKESSELFVHLALVRLKSLTASSLSSLEACIYYIYIHDLKDSSS